MSDDLNQSLGSSSLPIIPEKGDPTSALLDRGASARPQHLKSFPVTVDSQNYYSAGLNAQSQPNIMTAAVMDVERAKQVV